MKATSNTYSIYTNNENRNRIEDMESSVDFINMKSTQCYELRVTGIDTCRLIDAYTLDTVIDDCALYQMSAILSEM